MTDQQTPSPDLVTLEPVDESHAAAIQEMASHPEVLATTNLPDPYPEDGAIGWVEMMKHEREEGVGYAFAIIAGAGAEVQTGTVVGVTSLLSVDPPGTERRTAELGYWIGRSFWGQGFATEANWQLMRWAFRNMRLDEVFARPLVANEPSWRVLEKIGFERVGTETHEHPKWTEDDLVYRYVLHRQEGGDARSESDSR